MTVFRYLTLLSICTHFLIFTASAEEVTLSGQFIEGGLIIGASEPGATITLDGQKLRVGSDGTFIFGFHRDAPEIQKLTIRYKSGREEQRIVNIKNRNYSIQRIDGLPDKKVSPPPAVLNRIRQEADAVRQARKRDTDIVEFKETFLWPAQGTITGIYGSQRVLNGQPRQPHYGVDIAAPTGTPFFAPAGGIVSFADPDLYFSGGTVMIDHGHGLASTFLHIEKIEVRIGQYVQRGERVGTVGATGRATGPHLDWRVNWFDKRIDPTLLNIEGGPE